MKNVKLVIGGSGFIGRNLVENLLSEGEHVRILSRTGASQFFLSSPPRLEVVQWDSLREDFPLAALQDVSHIFHLASATQPKSSNENMNFDIQSNLIYSLKIMEAAAKVGGVRIIFISSGGTVYGKPKVLPISEEHPTKPTCSYGVVKLAIEGYLHLFEQLHGLEYRILRVSNPFGPHQHLNPTQGVIGNFIHSIASQRPLNVWGDGSVVRDYIYVSDVVRAMRLAENHAGKGRIFNIGSGNGKSLNELIATISEAMKIQPTIIYLAPRSFDVPVNVLNITCAKNELCWVPEISLDEGIARTIESVRHAA